MKRGRKTAADRLPILPDLRQPWQIANAAKCGCGGSDDMCPCQNDPELFTRPCLSTADLHARIAQLEADLKASDNHAKSLIADLAKAREERDSAQQGRRTFAEALLVADAQNVALTAERDALRERVEELKQCVADPYWLRREIAKMDEADEHS